MIQETIEWNDADQDPIESGNYLVKAFTDRGSFVKIGLFYKESEHESDWYDDRVLSFFLVNWTLIAWAKLPEGPKGDKP